LTSFKCSLVILMSFKAEGDISVIFACYKGFEFSQKQGYRTFPVTSPETPDFAVLGFVVTSLVLSTHGNHHSQLLMTLSL